ncbi:MAG TPA: hypothetical protein VK541_14390, partial [Pedobacter sp.]|nr:hypothetical protein [Pedobacter sp.]
MKSIKSLLTLFIALLTCQLAFGQSGFSGINYQGVARNTNGTVLSNQAIKVKISILGGANNGPVQYMEEHSLNTNALGLFTLQIGKGTPGSGTFAAIPWQNVNQYAKVEIALGGGAYTALGSTQLMSVPFALYAASGNPGPQGPAGPQGTQGIQGVQGPPGVLNGPAGGDLGGNYPNPTIGDNKVVTAKIADGSVTLPKLAPGVIPAALPPNGAAGGDLSGSYPDPLIGDNKVITAKVADGAITLPKLAPGIIPTTLPPNGAAGGDLSGNYPNPVVAQLQSKPVTAAAPALNDILKFNGVAWAPSPIGGGGAFVLPFAATENNASTLFSLTNDGDGTSLEGINNTTTSSIAALRGIVSSVSPGGFSSAVRGINNGTGGLGIGVWGSQSGSGWGVYGVTPTGLGVYGNSSGAGTGVYANSNTGTGLSATSNSGIAASVSIFNNANTNTALTVSTLGNGAGVAVTTAVGTAVDAGSSGSHGVRGSTAVQSGAGVIGYNNGAGEAVVGLTTSDIAGAVV